MKKILVASGNQQVDDSIYRFDGFTVVASTEYKNEIITLCEEHQPDVLLLGEGLSGHESSIQIMMQLVKDFPNLRIVYLAGHVDLRDEHKVNSLGILVMAGIYDVVHERNISIQLLQNLLNNPKTEEQMSYLAKRVKDSQGKSKRDSLIEFEIPEEENTQEEDVYNNLFVVSSIKPGTGKSFLSTNIATAIAGFGVNTSTGKRPRVALIEADLQNLSVGTLLQIEDDKKHLKSVIDKVNTIINESGTLTASMKETEKANEHIRACFKPYYRAKNLEALVGSQLTFTEIENVKPYHYVYLIDAIIEHYDVVIVDTNSSLTHVTTFPLLHMAKHCYYVLNLDFNNVRNNVRYKDILDEMGIGHKVKYVLNEDITQDMDDSGNSGQNIEDLIFTADHLDDSEFKLEARIPSLPKTVFLNRLYEGTPVVLDDKKYTVKARYELMKVANQIWPIKNFKEIEEQALNQKNKKKKGLFF